mmetsp:Transcript_126567/g.253040  ORF Transcript_126567/g.253040 Transcript_126567/m.253040 type:complete len:84 (-) Transcript_126567:60-311(-)
MPALTLAPAPTITITCLQFCRWLTTPSKSWVCKGASFEVSTRERLPRLQKAAALAHKAAVVLLNVRAQLSIVIDRFGTVGYNC